MKQFSIFEFDFGFSIGRSKKKAFTLASGALLLALSLPAEAQQAGKIYRVGYLSGNFPDSSLGIHSVKRELHSFGYVEGKNIAFEYRFAEDKPERIPPLADELVRLKVDVIIAGGSSDTRGAKNATRTIPIVFLESVSDPVALGLVASLAPPGRQRHRIYDDRYRAGGEATGGTQRSYSEIIECRCVVEFAD